MRDLRVAIVSDAILGRNGVGTYYQDLRSHLTGHLAAVELICPEQERDRTIERFAIPMPGDASQRLGWPRRDQLQRRLETVDPHLIIIPTIGPYSFAAYRYARRRDIPFVFANHTNFRRLASLYWPRPIARSLGRLLAWCDRCLVRQAAAVAAIDPVGYREAADSGARVVRVMGTPIAAEFIHRPCPPVSERIREILFVGRLAAEKGLPRLLEAACQLPQMRLTIVGDGPQRNRVRRAASKGNNIVHRGWLSRREVLDQIDRSDLLVLPSTVETFGTVALEALARRRFVMVAEECGITKWSAIRSGIFRFSRHESLAEAIRKLDAMPTRSRQETGEQSWRAVRAFHDHTMRNWMRFLVDASESRQHHPEARDQPEAIR